jgi:hypothetical protein
MSPLIRVHGLCWNLLQLSTNRTSHVVCSDMKQCIALLYCDQFTHLVSCHSLCTQPNPQQHEHGFLRAAPLNGHQGSWYMWYVSCPAIRRIPSSDQARIMQAHETGCHGAARGSMGLGY